MKKLIFILALAILSSPFLSPIQRTEAAQLQTQVVNLGNRTLPRNGVRIPFVQVNLRAVGGPIEINGVTVGRTGLSSSEDFGRIWAETDNFRRSNSRRLTNNDRVELDFRTPLAVRPGTTERLTVYANLEFEGGGRTAALNLVRIDHNGVEIEKETERRNSAPAVQTRQIPVFTQSRSRHNRELFRISCKNQVCQLVPRN